MKYAFLLLYAALIFGMCFLCDKIISALFRWAKNRKTVRLPLRYPLVSALLVLVAAGVGVYAVCSKSLLFGLAAVVFLGVAICAFCAYRSTEITYDQELFQFRKGSIQKTFYFRDIVGQRADVTRRVKCLVLCIGENDVVLYSNMQGYEPFLTTAYKSWCAARSLDPEKQDWHDPEDTRWFPDMPEEE